MQMLRLIPSITKVINKYGPYNLVYLGAPEDEYEQEIAMIEEEIRRVRSYEELADVIENVFVSTFSESAITRRRVLQIAYYTIEQIKADHPHLIVGEYRRNENALYSIRSK